ELGPQRSVAPAVVRLLALRHPSEVAPAVVVAPAVAVARLPPFPRRAFPGQQDEPVRVPRLTVHAEAEVAVRRAALPGLADGPAAWALHLLLVPDAAPRVRPVPVRARHGHERVRGHLLRRPSFESCEGGSEKVPGELLPGELGAELVAAGDARRAKPGD